MLLVLALPAAGWAQQTNPLQQPVGPAKKRVLPGYAEYAAVGTLTGGMVLASAILRQPETAKWTGGLLFDDGVRSVFRARTESGRALAGNVSDAMMFSTMAYPILVDAIWSRGIVDGDAAGAFHMVVDDAAAFLITGIFVGTMKNAIGRERPAMRDCPECVTTTSNQSFPSGHTAMAFTGAGLMCSNEIQKSGFGMTCLGGLALASTTGILRIAADRHYATDVLAGAAIGFASGYLVPLLLQEIFDH